MKQKIKTTAVSGFPEYLPADQLLLNQLRQTIAETYRSFAFIPLDTPALERREVLLAKAGSETEHQIYYLENNSDDLALRFDLTVPLARYISEYGGALTFPFKRYQIAKVYRGERPQKGRYREFYQADIDIIGEGLLSLSAEAEIIKVLATVFKKLAIGPFTIKISNRKLLSGLLAWLNLSEASAEILRILDKLPKIGEAACRRELEKLELNSSTVKEILEFVSLKENVLEKLGAFDIKHPDFVVGLGELQELAQCLADYGVSAADYAFDLSIARGLDYYTGTVWETFLDNYPELGSICSGGRYENLVAGFNERAFPGVGASIGLSRLFYQLKTAGLLVDSTIAVSDALVISDNRQRGEALADSLRRSGLSVAGAYGPEKLKKKLALANHWSVKTVYILGEEELAVDEVSVKDMLSGSQKRQALSDFI
ncbi:histidine--tRNA ligase [Candidatus Falkowbacteria bacterium]|nr:histidine--tRNA ligase [Patescibacteria group bacterium]NCU43090.1 histidine--tRNA ligase [Candidatus Falkowbacteria bacterium]